MMTPRLVALAMWCVGLSVLSASTMLVLILRSCSRTEGGRSELWRMPCNCGSPTCRREIGDVRSVPPQHLQKYLRAGALQDFILASLRIPLDSSAS
jgi:hypothetical protein